MSSFSVGTALTVLLLFISTVDADEGGVTFWRKEVTMTCPGKGTWHDKATALNGDIKQEKYTFQYENSKKRIYHCEYTIEGTDNHNNPATEKYYFYIQGKACESCFELNPIVFGLAIAGDLVFTAFVMMIVFRCGKKRSSDGLSMSNTSTAPAHRGGRGPPVPSPDYEKLNHHNRNEDPYSQLERTARN